MATSLVHRSRRFAAAVALAASVLAAGALAAERAGVRMADQTTVHGQNLVLNGLGVREATVFHVDVYVAGLYLPQRSSDPSQILRSDEPKLVQLAFVHDVKRDQMTKAWQEGFQKNDGARISALQSRIDQLNGYMTDMKKGDTLGFAYIPGQGVEVRAGRVPKGTIPGDDFAQALFSIWLGAHPPNDGLKAGMLGRE